MEKVFDDELRKLRTGGRTNLVRKISIWHIILILILVVAAYLIIQYGAEESRENKLTDEERNLTYEILSQAQITPLPESNWSYSRIQFKDELRIPYSAKDIHETIKKLSQPENIRLNQQALFVIVGAVLLFIVVVWIKSSPSSKYLSIKTQIAIVAEDLETRDLNHKYEIGLASAMQWWQTLGMQEQPMISKSWIPFDLYLGKGVQHWVCMLDPRREPEVEGHILGYREVPEGWEGKRIQDIKVVLADMGRYTKSLPEGATGF